MLLVKKALMMGSVWDCHTEWEPDFVEGADTISYFSMVPRVASNFHLQITVFVPLKKMGTENCFLAHSQ